MKIRKKKDGYFINKDVVNVNKVGYSNFYVYNKEDKVFVYNKDRVYVYNKEDNIEFFENVYKKKRVFYK